MKAGRAHPCAGWPPLVLGAALAMAVLWLWVGGQRTNFQDLALGLNTSAVFLPHDGDHVHCSGFPAGDQCLADAAAKPWKRRLLILSASQLYSINDYRPGEVTAPWIVTDQSRPRGDTVTTFSMPNLNMQEALVLHALARSRLRLDALVLPLVYDDMREEGVRDQVIELADRADVAAGLDRTEAGRAILAEAGARARSATTGATADKTLADRTEAALSRLLDSCCALWALREEARGRIDIAMRRAMHGLAYLRNRYTRDLSALRIPVPDQMYRRNRAAIEAMLATARADGTRVLMYVVPRPTDFFPYDPDRYRAFKDDMASLAASHGARLVNLEDLVPNEDWGTTEITVGYPIRDHFHFKAEGHRLLGAELARLTADLFR